MKMEISSEFIPTYQFDHNNGYRVFILKDDHDFHYNKKLARIAELEAANEILKERVQQRNMIYKTNEWKDIAETMASALQKTTSLLFYALQPDRGELFGEADDIMRPALEKFKALKGW